MTAKTEDDIARDKDAVEKMRGAKTSMEAALRRIHTLETSLKDAVSVADDMRKQIGPNVYVKTWHHGLGGGGEAKLVPIHDVLAALAIRIAGVL